MEHPGPESRKSPVALIVAAWMLVSIPAAWGVYNTGKNAVKLFHPQSAAQQK